MRVITLVLAAGASTRFGSPKLLAPLDGRPLIQHTLDRVAESGFDDVVVVLGAEAPAIEAAVAWRAERRIRNPRPEEGLSSSLRLGLTAAAEDAAADAVLVVLADQPWLRPDVIAALLAGAELAPEPIVRVRYAGDDAPNPVLIRRAAWALAGEARGDRGLGPLLRQRPDLVAEVPVQGSNPDVDTPGDLAQVAENARAR